MTSENVVNGRVRAVYLGFEPFDGASLAAKFFFDELSDVYVHFGLILVFCPNLKSQFSDIAQKKRGTHTPPVPLLEVFALPVTSKRTANTHAVYIGTQKLLFTYRYITRMGIYRCHISDVTSESCEVSRSQKHSVINALVYNNCLSSPHSVRKVCAKIVFFIENSRIFLHKSKKNIFFVAKHFQQWTKRTYFI